MNDPMKQLIVAILIAVAQYLCVRFIADILFKQATPGNRFDSLIKQKWKKASKDFGYKESKLRKMKRGEVKKMFRDKAKQCHPDHGGSAEKFRNVYESYQFVYAFSSV